MMILHLDSTNTIEVQEDDSSYRYRSLMAHPQLMIKFSVAEYMEIPVGTWCEYQGEKFFLLSPDNIKKNGVRNIEITLNMETEEANLAKYKMRNTVDNRLKFSLCATPKEFIEEIVGNLNKRDGDGTWKVGTCIEATEKTIEFNHSYCDAALSSVCDTFETEYEIIDHTINLGKVEYFKDDPLPLSYGKGNGFIPGVGRTTESDDRPIDILYVQGGEKNIDRSKYGSSELLLPKSQELEYDGKIYVSSADGYSIKQKGKTIVYHNEDSLDCSETYPSRIGTVSSVDVADADKNFYDIIDNSIPDALNYNNYLIEGDKMTIIFQSGMLAGDDKEFELTYKHAEKRFELVPQEIDGVTMPNATYIPAVGDTYVIFGCTLPDAYICDNDTKTGASWDMFKEAAKHLCENEEQKFTFTGTLQGLWCKNNWENVGGRLKVGSYIKFIDEQFMKDGIDIRITGIKDFTTSPYSPTIELSNSVSCSSISSQLREITKQEVMIDENHKQAIQFTKRRFRDAQETIFMLNELINDSILNFSSSVNPITVQTMAALVGDESLQFRFITSRTDTTVKDDGITYSNTDKILHIPHSFIQHMTIGISSISSDHSLSEYSIWEMTEFSSSYLDDGKKKYYLYAKVSSTDTSSTGTYLLSENPIAMNVVDGYYHLLVGVLNSESDDERSFVTLYGYTEVLPGRITTNKIVSASGKSYFDMVNNAMKLGDALDFNSKNDGKLRIKGTIVQSESGDESYLGVFRGDYNSTYTYYYGDEVTYTADGATCTYRFIADSPAKGMIPSNTQYWMIVASGADGLSGNDGKDGINGIAEYREEQYSSDNNSWHDDYLATDYYMRYRTVNVNGSTITYGDWSAGVRCRKDGKDGYTPQKGTDYYDGKDGSFVSFIYILSDTSITPNGGSFDGTTETVPTGWSDNPVYSATVKTQVSTTRYTKQDDGIWKNDGWSASVQYLGVDGKDGADGTSINIKGTKDSVSDLPTPPANDSDCYIIGQDLYVWDGYSWVNAGQFKGDTGEAGADGSSAYVHIKYANSMEENDWSDNDGETPSSYIGIYCDDNVSDQLTWSLYQWMKWKGEDGLGYEYIYKRTTTETSPATPTTTSQTDGYVPTDWTDDPTGIDDSNPYEWLCYRKKSDGVWGSFKGSASDNSKAALWAKYGKDGEKGISPNTAYKSTVFIRANTKPTTPIGGSYASPIPSGWNDGVPSGETILWASTRIFSSDGLSPQQDAWTEPMQMTDTASIDIEFSSEANPTSPTGHPNTNTQWNNTSSTSTIWMATCNKSNGVWDEWQVQKIKGEKGDDGTSIKVKGTLSSESDLPTPPADASDCYIIGQDLYVWDGDSWVNAGKFKGETGESGADGSSAYVHIKYANSMEENDWSDNDGETPSAYIGIYCDNLPTDSMEWNKYTWTKWKGEDGFGYEYIYKLTSTNAAPSTPTDTSQTDDYVPSGWSDDPVDVSSTNPYCWICYRKKMYGVWGSFIGSSFDNSKAALWAKFGNDGVISIATYIEEQFSADGVNDWHDDFLATDYYKRYRTVTVKGDEISYGNWSAGVRCREDGKDGYTPQKGTDYYDGKDGSFVSFIYILSDTSITPNGGSFDGTTETVPTGWSDNPVYSATVKTQVSTTRYTKQDDSIWKNDGWSASVQYLGVDGVDGTNEEKIFMHTEMDISPSTPTTSQTDDYVPSGWSDDPVGVSKEYPFEWISIRLKNDKVWGDFSTPTLWSTYSLQSNINLLEQTEFKNSESMSKWDVSDGEIVSGTQGHNSFYRAADFTDEYIDMLRQVVLDSSKTAISASSWYTLSFYAKASSFIRIPINETSSAYGFAIKNYYFSEGKQSSVYVQGYCSQAALDENRYLRIYIHDDSWSFSTHFDIKTTTSTYVGVSFTVPTSGVYTVDAYLYSEDSTLNGTTTTATVTVSLYMIDRGHTLDTYIYPDDVDNSVCYADGKLCTTASDGSHVWVLSSSWEKHTFTFKTASLISGIKKVLFRLNKDSNEAYICMPKLEEGKVATSYNTNTADATPSYYEYRYAVNGSRSTPPTIDTTAIEPTGWSTEMPLVGELQYLWFTVAKKSGSGELLTEWSTPARQTGYDGTNGNDGPCVVYRGVYDSTKTYYGTSLRVDAIKYNDVYYVCRVDAGTFTSIVPTDTTKWNAFGGQFESIATNLLLAEGASIGNWFISGGKIVSTLESGNIIELDATNKKISVTSSKSGDSETIGTGGSFNSTIGSKIEINADSGRVEVNAVNTPSYSTGTAYLSPSGIFANLAGTNALPVVSGATHRGAIVGLGFADLDYDEVFGQDSAIVAGVYGRASNAGTAPAYGGYFRNLCAAGLVLKIKYISDDAATTAVKLSEYCAQVIGVTNLGVQGLVYLPSDGELEGRVIFAKQAGSGTIRFMTQSGHKIYDDNTANDYYDLECGHELKFTFTRYYINSVLTEVWQVSAWMY